MGQRKNDSSREPKEKKTPVKIRPIPRKHAGKVTEPWAIMERLIDEVAHFSHLKVARIKLFWQKDWKADVDGIATGAQVCKASELDRNIAEDAGAETPDVFIKLPESQWPTLDAIEKEHRIFHELCHVKPAKDANGEQKIDSKDRLLWRLGRHPITAFHEEIERYGVEAVIGHNAKIVESIAYADRPMEKIFDKSESAAAIGDSWKNNHVSAAGFTEKQIEALESSGILNLGQLQEAMNRGNQWWAKNSGVSGSLRQGIEDAFNAYLMEILPPAAA